MNHSRSLTVAELLALGVIAAGVSSVWLTRARETTSTTRTSEAVAMLQGIRAAELTLEAEGKGYAGCSGARGLNAEGLDIVEDDLHPRSLDGLGKHKTSLDDGSPLGECFKRLGVRADGPVFGAYAISAGPAGAPLPKQLAGTRAAFQEPLPSPGPQERWFVAVAVTNHDEDAHVSRFRVSSLAADVLQVDTAGAGSGCGCR
jgi:hypothetical protein